MKKYLNNFFGIKKEDEIKGPIQIPDRKKHKQPPEQNDS